MADGESDTSDPAEYSIQLWDVERGTEVRRFKGHTDTVSTIAFSADGRRALSGGMRSRT